MKTGFSFLLFDLFYLQFCLIRKNHKKRAVHFSFNSCAALRQTCVKGLEIIHRKYMVLKRVKVIKRMIGQKNKGQKMIDSMTNYFHSPDDFLR